MNKMYQSIKEVSDLLELPPHVLRYWESEFTELRPRKNRSGNRIYREADIVLLREIKELLHAQRYTIEGARNELKLRRGEGTLGDSGRRAQAIAEARSTIREVLALMQPKPAASD